MNVFRTYPLLSRVLVFIIAPLIGVAAYERHLLKLTLPQTEGSLSLRGLNASVSIRRDQHGVPAIRAASDHDAFFAVGYVHAGDRLWQLELQRRVAYGRLSELLGRSSVMQDVWFRTLGFQDLVKSSWRGLSADAQDSLTAYAAGVNAWIDTHHDLPIEFQLLGAKPEPWTPYDSLACAKLLALNLGVNYRSEISRLLTARLANSKNLDIFFPNYPQDGPTTVGSMSGETVASLQALLGLQEDVESRLALGGRYVGSNAWVVSGRNTSTGLPILANDLHLGLQIPSLWYAVRVQGKTLNVSGMSLPGIPLVIIGKNENIAWGVTNMMADAQDLYFEQPSPANLREYMRDGGSKPFDEHAELIKVRPDFPGFLHKALQPVTVQVRSSMHGPIISDVFSVLPQPVALRWVALDPDDTSYEAFFRLDYATDWNTFEQALGKLVAPALNVLYADAQGNIGYLGAGRIPIRAKGEGTSPVAGWDKSYDWLGYIPTQEMPRAFNPSDGYIISANNKIIGPAYKYFISHDWAPPARAARINEMLQERLQGGRRLSVSDIMRIQRDLFDRQVGKLLPTMLQLEPKTDRQAQAKRHLAKWRGDMTQQSTAASIFYAWSRHLRLALFSDDLNLDWPRLERSRFMNQLIESVDAEGLNAALHNSSMGWCSDPYHLPERKLTCADVLHRSLDAALEELEKLTSSSNMDDWAWGKVHRTFYKHAPFGEIKILDKIFNRQIQAGGSVNSINMASSTYDENKGYMQFLGADVRQIIEIGRKRDLHLYMNSTGQSGNIVDVHYDDMIAPFRDAKYFDFAAGNGRGGDELRLEPEAK